MNGKVAALFIAPAAGAPMEEMKEVRAIAGAGLQGDRYASGEGSYNKGRPGKRQVTLINEIFFEGSGFEYSESRRNIVTSGVELMWLIGREFQVGGATLKGVKYCDPCRRPTMLSGKESNFQEAFFDRGGLVAEVIQGGLIKQGDMVILPAKGY